jgi:hypothetical protein
MLFESMRFCQWCLFGWKKELKGNSTGTSTRQIASSKESHGKCCSPLGANRQLGRARGVPCLYPRALQSESLAHPRLKLSIQVHELEDLIIQYGGQTGHRQRVMCGWEGPCGASP